MAAPSATQASEVRYAKLVYGTNPEKVIALIQDRAARWRQGPPTPDGHKIGLVIEGGGMRAVCWEVVLRRWPILDSANCSTKFTPPRRAS